MKLYDRDRGSVMLDGTEGAVVIDRDGYDVYNWHGKQTDKFRTGAGNLHQRSRGRDSMTDLHFANFINSCKGT